MRLLDSIQVKRVSEEPDGYGGLIKDTFSLTELAATISVKDDDLRVKPSGLGYYRSVTVVVNKDAPIEQDDIVEFLGVEYIVTREVDYSKPFHKVLIGYEV